MSTSFSWIKKNYLNNILKSYDVNVDILSFSISPLPCGENFTSRLYKIIINCKNSCKNNEKISLILKCLPDGDFLLTYAKNMKLFENEIDMYSRVLPNIYKLRYVKKISTACLHASLSLEPTLILEDLNESGYKMQNRHNGLDLDHCLLVMEKLAYLHASSMAISKKESLSNFNLGIFWNNPYTVRWITIGVDSLIKTCKRSTYLNKYAEKLNLLENSFLDKAFAVTANDTRFNVLNHGDCWVNNLMFLYDQDGTVKDALLIDFQQCLYSSPAVDLHYFWATSPNVEVMTNHLNYILDYYYDKFSKDLIKLDVLENIPSKNEFDKEFKSHAFHGLTTLVTTVPFLKSSQRSDASLESFYNFAGKDSFRYDCFNNERYIERISYLLPFYESLEVFG